MSTPDRWDAVDGYVEELVVGEDDALRAARESSEKAGLPAIALTPALGKLMHLLVRVQGARRVLELGTLGGYSTIWLARALPDGGELITLELDEGRARVAAQNVERAGVSGLVEIRVTDALEGMRALIEQDAGPFDFIFIDADKQGTPAYFEHALELSRPGSAIVTDNVVRGGEIVDADSRDPGVLGMRRFQELLAADRAGAQRVSATTVQTVGAKGYDGFTLAIVQR